MLFKNVGESPINRKGKMQKFANFLQLRQIPGLLSVECGFLAIVKVTAQ
jgi:hypothetical protein